MRELSKLPDRPSVFFGREQALADLDLLVRRNRRSFTPIVVGGVGGVGKTTLVAEYVTRRYLGEDLAWLSLYETSSPGQKIDELLIRLQIDSADAPSVVVIDGAEVIPNTELESAFKRLFNYKRIETILVTTRSAARLSGVEYLTLTGFGLEDAVSFLATYTGDSQSESELSKIATSVALLPLALGLIGVILQRDPNRNVWPFLQGTLYTLEDASSASPARTIKAIQPQIVTVTESLVERLKSRPEDIHRISPRQFEELVAELMSSMGWDVELTGKTRDGGKDILAYLNTDVGRILCLVEAKRYSRERPVGVEVVRSLYGTFCDYQANSAMLVTTSRFSADARQFQKKHKYQLSLRDYSDVANWIDKYNGQ
jgi:restriction system protein